MFFNPLDILIFKESINRIMLTKQFMRNSKALSRTLRLFTAATEGPSVESLGFALNTTYPDYSTLAVDSTTNESIAHLQLNRPHKGNSFNMLQWNEYKQFYNDTNKSNFK